MGTANHSFLRQLIDGTATKTATETNVVLADSSPKPNSQTSPSAPGKATVEVSIKSSPLPHADFTETSPRATANLADHLKMLAESAPVALAIFDASLDYLYANHRWLEVFRLEQGDITGRNHYELFPSLHPGWRHVYERGLAGQIVRSDRDTVNQAGVPVLYRWEVRPWHQADSSIGGLIISCLSIVGLKTKDLADGAANMPQAAATVEATTELWDLPLPLIALDAAGCIRRSGAGATPLFLAAGLKEGETKFWQLFGERAEGSERGELTKSALGEVLSGRRDAVVVSFKSGAEDEADQIPATWHFTKLKGAAGGFEQDVVLGIGLHMKEGIHLNGRHAPEDGGTSEELARLRIALKESGENEKNLRQREARLRAVLDAAPCGLLVIDERGRPVFHNTRAAALLGRAMADGQSVEDWLAQSCRDEKHHDEVVRQWRENVWRKQLTRIVSITSADGLLKDVELRPASLPGGGLLVMLQDVTEERRSEELLRGTEAKFRALVHENPLPIVLADRSGSVFEANAATEDLLGYTRAELRRMGMDQWMIPEGLAARAATLRDMIQCGDLSADVAVELMHRNGAAIPANLRLASVPDVQGSTAATVNFFQVEVNRPPAVFEALTESIKALEDPAPEVSELPPRLVPVPSMLLMSTDFHGRIIEWTETAAGRFGLVAADLLGRGLHTVFRPSDATGFYAELSGLVEKGESKTVEWFFAHPVQGRVSEFFIVEPNENSGMSVNMLTIPYEELAPALPVDEAAPAETGETPEAKPSPARPSAEELKRERLILGETHHRMKNHLQIITSMLNLQLSTLQHEDAREALRSSQNRVRSIAALHQHLYSLAVGEVGGFKDFAGQLIAHLRDCYDVTPERVALEIDLPEGPVPEEWLMPLALALNEMVSNAFKHAYPEGKSGRMKVALFLSNNAGELLVKDDGAGLPSDFDNTHFAGLGMKILRVFAGQLGGEVQVQGGLGQGAEFKLRFPSML